MPINGFLVVDPNGRSKPHDHAAVTNSIRNGKLNCLFEVTLTAGAGTTTVTEATHPGASRIGPDSCLLPMPLTANAATELAAGSMWASAQSAGSMTWSHANNGQTDRRFRIAVIG